jgi:hypothetical protein
VVVVVDVGVDLGAGFAEGYELFAPDAAELELENQDLLAPLPKQAVGDVVLEGTNRGSAAR